ncbi:hypothetical protein A2276_00625 [candidate division WOR-1 bacterium RIFOXYA12_FULL_43_27]|uniref:NADH:ubiquinone oxidoreductase intermediate-associated protein 30 domain-containing protein n=1 Tax=candidate division WOR-1 bacterium RIFOXYC2_FULL_46_14 TaxID=1802587 RepID=A0A1F4U4H5_UNCSA|nr:MAG: hypothetical protein A2276_00625 [candidate division WOR-1 bacterium RIFOXYA12_FULL_43_27]OGC20804.1 MAG: hypothetical protein A2292_07250 [candidate division WOR-1 bacterium RIFOXYB2_FULL_46_45]OGC31459.1 MAG: hypothetical protein A2232_04200 [candidate division WOR-1 bacterium RIFOXYA2_FULL_46_56]OGC39864.1 MAG: hypothetical protein A2438_05035 [candidate division WOR-1 bacterium RIFOXYC2_FULL_46_14]
MSLCLPVLFASLVFGAGSVGIMIDNFEDGNPGRDPEWWVFDNLKLKSSGSPAKDALALDCSGRASDWYVGGMGAYLAKDEYDFSSFNSLELSVFGFGPKSGTLKIELYEDDNGNWQIEQDPKKNYSPVFDDRFSYELKINWKGWKEVRIPLSDFTDTNPRAGDNVWNPQKLGKSGGLIQMQLYVLAASRNGSVHFILDNLRFSSR